VSLAEQRPAAPEAALLAGAVSLAEQRPAAPEAASLLAP